MEIHVDYGKPALRKSEIFALTARDLDDFYASAAETDRFGLFFVLLTTLCRLEEREEREAAARVCYLTAYYVFTTLTPPGSLELARHYIRRALALHPTEEYREWLALMESGN